MAGIFSLRNWVMKQLMKTDKSGVMKIPDKGKIDFGEMLVKESLFQKGIHPGAIKNEKQLDNILNTPVVPKSERVKPKKSGEVIEVDFGNFPEKKAGGGRTGLSYLLAEDTNERMPLAAGGMGRRAFLKLMAALGATGVAAKSGLSSLFKAGKPVSKTLTQVPIKNIEGMPAWFKPLVNKVIKEGEQVKVTEYDRLITHKTKLPNSKTDVYVNQDLNNGDVWVDIGRDKHGFPDGKYGQPVRLEYKASEVIEPPLIKDGQVVGTQKGVKTKDEFWVEEAEFTGGHPENVKFEESVIEKFGDHGSNFDEVEMFATGKFKKSKPTKKAEKLEWEQGKAEADADAAADMADDFASGGLAGLLGERVPYRYGKTARSKKRKPGVRPIYWNMPPQMIFREPVNFPYKSLEDIPEDVLAMLKKDPNFDLETFLTKVGWSDPDKTRIQTKLKGKDEAWGLYSPLSDTSFLNYQQFGKSEPIGDGLLSIKSPSDADKVQTILHEMRHAKMREPWFMKSSAIPKWVREYEERGEPHYLDKDIKDKHSQYRDTQKDVSGEELFVRFMDQHFGDVAEKGSVAGSDYKPYFDKILKDYWDPYAERYKDILKEEKRVKSKPYGLASGGIARMLGE
jgi:hypothetical protein